MSIIFISLNNRSSSIERDELHNLPRWPTAVDILLSRDHPSVPEDEDSLGLEDILCLNQVLNGVLAVVGDLGPQVVDEEGLGEVVFIVGEGHGLEVEGHQGAGLNIAELEAPGRGVGVGVEELGDGGAVLGEVSAIAALIPLLIVIEDVVGGGGEELVELLVLEDLIEDPDLIDGGLGTLVSDAGSGNEREEDKVDLPDQGLVEHQEGKASVGEEGAGPTVVHSVEASADLIEVVNSACSPLPEVVSEEIVAELILLGISLGL